MLTERQEIQIVKIITKNCTVVQETNTVYDGGYVILDIFKLVDEINEYYKLNKIK